MEVARLLRLDRPSPDGRVLIHLRICWQGNKVRLSSGEKVRPADWDKAKGQVKSRVQFSSDINNRLDTYESGIKKFAYQTENAGTILTEAMVRSEVERIRREELGVIKPTNRSAPVVEVVPAQPTISEFVQQYVQERSADRSPSWKESVEIVGRHLDAFRAGLTWSDLKLSTLNNFKVYLQDELNHSDATLETYIGLLRGMLKYAGRTLPVPGDWLYLEVRRVGDSLMPDLQLDEVNYIRNAQLFRPDDLPPAYDHLSKDAIEETRWYFLAACGTGLRHSDLWQLQNPRLTTIEGVPCVEVWQQKTKNRVPVPLNEQTYELIKNPINKQSPLGLIYYNKSLKVISEQAGLDRSVRVGSYYKGQLLTEELPLYATVNSHMARRTFATVMTAGGMPTRTLQILMGHSSISSTEKYANVPNATLIHQTVSVWNKIAMTPSVTPNK